MRREKFIYNTQTLRYEKVVEPLSVTLFRIFGFICAAVFTAFVLTLLTHRYFPSPNERLLLSEIDQLKSELSTAVEELALMEKALGNIQQRDAYAHRMILGMDPIDQAVWEGGVGGHDEYSHFRQFRHSGDVMASLRQKTDRLKRQLDLQSRSLDSIIIKAEQKEDMLASIPSIKPVGGDRTRSMNLLSGFGYRLHPIHKIRKMHNGIDFTAPKGTPIQATGNGRVVKAEYSSGFGYHVVIDHGYGYKTLYAHMQRVEVRRGETVKRGKTIGRVGNTGTSTAPHCHYEVHYRGVPVNPIQFVTDGLSPAEYRELVRASEVSNQSFD